MFPEGALLEPYLPAKQRDTQRLSWLLQVAVLRGTLPELEKGSALGWLLRDTRGSEDVKRRWKPKRIRVAKHFERFEKSFECVSLPQSAP